MIYTKKSITPRWINVTKNSAHTSLVNRLKSLDPVLSTSLSLHKAYIYSRRATVDTVITHINEDQIKRLLPADLSIPKKLDTTKFKLLINMDIQSVCCHGRANTMDWHRITRKFSQASLSVSDFERSYHATPPWWEI